MFGYGGWAGGKGKTKGAASWEQPFQDAGYGDPALKRPRTEGMKGKGKGKNMLDPWGLGGGGFGMKGGWPMMGMMGMMGKKGSGGKGGKSGKARNAPGRAGLPAGLLDSVPKEGTFIEILTEAAVLIVGSIVELFVEGSRLSLMLMEAFPEQVKEAKTVARGKDGKGWLKAILQDEARLANVKVSNRNEPCFCLAENAPADGTIELAPGKTSPPPDVSALAQTVDGAAAVGTFLEMVCAALEEVEYLEGSSLVKAVQAADVTAGSEVLKSVRTGMKSAKGWLKAVVAHDPRVTVLQIETRNEPCYRLVSKGDFAGA